MNRRYLRLLINILLVLPWKCTAPEAPFRTLSPGIPMNPFAGVNGDTPGFGANILNLLLSGVNNGLPGAGNSLSEPWPYRDYKGNILCSPIPTPKMGTKWCLFDSHQAEVGSICQFKCIKGYTFVGADVVRCVLSEDGASARLNDTIGLCRVDSDLLPNIRDTVVIQSVQNKGFLHVEDSPFFKMSDKPQTMFYVYNPGLNMNVDKLTVSLLVVGRMGSSYLTQKGNILVLKPFSPFADIRNLDAQTFILHGDVKKNEIMLESFSLPGYYVTAVEDDSVELRRLETGNKPSATFKWIVG